MLKYYMSLLVLLSIFNPCMAKKEIPVEYFNRLPMIQAPILSPDGKTIATIYNQGDETQVAIVPFDNPSDFKILIKLGKEKYRIGSIAWVNNDRLIVSVNQPIRIDTIKARISHLYSIGVDGKYIELKSNAYRKAKGERKKYLATSYILSLLEDDPKHILVTSHDDRDGYNSSVFKVNIYTGKYSKYLPNKNHMQGWGVNHKGHILIAVGASNNNNNQTYYYVRENEKAKWKKIKTTQEYKTESFDPLIYDSDNHVLFVLSDYKLNKQAIWKYDTLKQDYIEVFAQAPGMLDVTDGLYLFGKGQRKLIGFSYEDEGLHNVYFDENSNKLSRDIDALFRQNGYGASIYDYDVNMKHYIISAYTNNKPTKYILFDAEKKKFIPWYSTYPQLSKYELSPVEPIEFLARDGMKLYGYYTAPIGVKNPPVVLFPHGGPYVRDTISFDSFVQLFASRGYAVLQVNFRGSTGFGKKYQEAGYYEWGGKMQTDLLDGLEWIKLNKNANTDKACIVGASYGGYAALVAGFQTPTKFKCIASIAGVSNLQQQITHWRVRGAEEYINNVIKVDTESVKSISPINHVNEFQVPVLLIHGEADTRVDYVQSEKMHKALKAAGKKSKFVSFKFGTHNLNDAANRKVAMAELDKFLKKYLK